VKLEDGSLEKFHKSYIIESLEAIGVDHISAKRIANEIKKHKGMTEHEIKVAVFKKLDMVNSEIANKYLSTKKVHVKSDASHVKGNVLLPEFLMSYLELKNGDKIDICHVFKHITLRAYELKDVDNHQSHDLIFMSEDDMKLIDVKEKHQVAICKHHEV
jgi:hypothetical protein